MNSPRRKSVLALEFVREVLDKQDEEDRKSSKSSRESFRSKGGKFSADEVIPEIDEFRLDDQDSPKQDKLTHAGKQGSDGVLSKEGSGSIGAEPLVLFARESQDKEKDRETLDTVAAQLVKKRAMSEQIPMSPGMSIFGMLKSRQHLRKR